VLLRIGLGGPHSGKASPYPTETVAIEYTTNLVANQDAREPHRDSARPLSASEPPRVGMAHSWMAPCWASAAPHPGCAPMQAIRRSSALVTLVVALAGTAAAPRAQAPDQGVEVPLRVVDRRGEPVVDLAAADLEVAVDGQPIPADRLTLRSTRRALAAGTAHSRWGLRNGLRPDHAVRRARGTRRPAGQEPVPSPGRARPRRPCVASPRPHRRTQHDGPRAAPDPVRRHAREAVRRAAHGVSGRVRGKRPAAPRPRRAAPQACACSR